MSLLNYSKTLVAGANENINDVATMFAEARAVINALDNANIASGANIDQAKIASGYTVAKLAALAAGKIIVGNGSGAPAAVTPSGDITMDNAGVFQLIADSVTDTELATGAAAANLLSGTIVDAKLASPTNAFYVPVVEAGGYLILDAPNDYYLLGSSGGANGMRKSAATAAIGSNDTPPTMIFVNTADRDIAGWTEKLRIRAVVACNATAPGCDIKIDLRALTVAGGADEITYTAGAQVTGSELTFSTPSASTAAQDVSGVFDLPSNGIYVMTAKLEAGGIANNSAVALSCRLQSKQA